MNVQALLHDSPPDNNRRRTDSQSWGTYPRRNPPSPPDPTIPSPLNPSPRTSSHPSPAMASLRPLDSHSPSLSRPPPPPQSIPSRRLTDPPQPVGPPGVWGTDKPGSDFQNERDLPRDIRDRPRDLPRDRDRPTLLPPLPPVFDQPRKKNIAMEVNGPLAGPGVPVVPPVSGSDDRRLDAGPSSRRPSISCDPGKKLASPTEDELRGRESQQRAHERPLREPSRERDRDAWETEMYQRNRDRKARERDPYMNPYSRPAPPDYRQPPVGMPSGPGIPPSGDYRTPPMDYRGQPPGRTPPQAELVVLKHSSGTSGPGVPGDRERERLDRDRALHPPYGVIGDRDREREREWEREREQERINMGMVYSDRDRDRGQPPGMVPLPPPSIPHGHSHPHHQHHREPSNHSHSLHPVSHHHHQPPPQHKAPSHSRHSHHVHHPQPQSSSQIQLLPHPHSHQPPHGHPSQPPHPPSSQPHSPHPGQMHGGPPPPHPQSHPVYRSQPPSQSAAQGPSGGGMSPLHHPHHHQHHPGPPSQQQSPHHHHPPGPPPPQRQFQNQFHTQFIPGMLVPPSRMGSPTSSHPQQQQPSQQQQQQQQQRAQTQGMPPGSGGSSGGSSQPQLPPSTTPKTLGGQELSENNNQRLMKKARVDVVVGKTGVEREREREGGVNLDVERNGRRSFMDVVEMVDGAATSTPAAAAAAEDVEGEVGQVAAAATTTATTPAAQAVVDDSWEEEEEEEEGDTEVKAKVKVNLGTFVYPKLPFPYFFDLGLGIEPRNEEEKEKSEVPLPPPVVESREKEGEVVEKELEKAEEKLGGGEDATSEEKKNDASTDKREDENMDGVDGEQKVVAVAAASTTSAVVTVKEEDSTLLDLETRVTVIIPNGFIPREKPLYPKIWGGGLLLLDKTSTAGGGTQRNGRGNNGRSGTKRALPRKQRVADDNDGKPISTPIVPRRRRRVYTDDSDLFLCALHSGWITWTGAWAARQQGKDVKLDLRVLRCPGAPGGARWVEDVPGRRRREDVVGRFLGGWGEKCFNEAGKVRKRQVDEKENGGDEDASDGDGEDDGRGLVSAAWGTSHDGSAIEVLGVEFVEKSTARSSPGVGLRNRAQRMYEYSERRANVLAPIVTSTSNGRSPLTRLAGRKRRRGCDWALSYPRRLPNAAVLDVIHEADEEEERGLYVDCDRSDERLQMNMHTVVFRPDCEGKLQTGFKYVPANLQELLFPGSTMSDAQPPKKRRKMEDTPDVEMADVDPPSNNTYAQLAPPRPIVLLAGSERYLVSPCNSEQTLWESKYDVSLVVGEGAASTSKSERESAIEEGQIDESDTQQSGPSMKLLNSGIGRTSFQFLKDHVVVVVGNEEELRIPVVSWHWWGVAN